MQTDPDMARRVWLLAFPLGMLITVGSLVSFEDQKPAPKPAVVKPLEPCAPVQVQQWPEGRDPSLDWVRVLNTLHSRIDQVEKKLDARPTSDPEVEELHRRLLAKPFPIYQGEITGKQIVLTPRKE